MNFIRVMKGRINKMRLIIYPVVLLMLCVGAVQTAWAAKPKDKGTGEEKVYAVQNRIFHRNHEIDLYGGFLTGDDFFQSYPLGIGYTYHFNNYLSWEVLRAQYMFNQEKDLKTNLENNFNVTPEFFPEPKYMYHTHLVFTPLYGKSALLNRWVVNNEIYFFGGLGLAEYEWLYSTGETRTEQAVSISFGAGMRYFISKRLCLKFEIRDLVNLREDATQNNLYFGVGLGYRFNFKPRKVEEDPTAQKLKRILNEGE
jgi:outer membrane beta-barrel protein